MQFFVGVVVGLLVGWNLFPQPEFIKRWIDKIKSKFITSPPPD